MRETIDVARGEDEAAAKLKRITSELALMVPGGASTLAALEIVGAQDVKEICGAEVGNSVGLALLVNQQRKVDMGFFAESAGVVAIAETDGS